MDFEALGKYTVARRKIAKLWVEYNKAATALSDVIQNANVAPIYNSLPLLDVAVVQRQFDELSEMYRQLAAACREANLQAQRCGETAIKIESA